MLSSGSCLPTSSRASWRRSLPPTHLRSSSSALANFGPPKVRTASVRTSPTRALELSSATTQTIARTAPAALSAVVVAVGAVPVTSPGIPILLAVVALAPAAFVQARWKQPPSAVPDTDAKSGAGLWVGR